MKEYPLKDQSYRDRALQSLMQSSLFSPLPAGDLDLLLSYANFLEYAPQELILRQGDPSDSFFLLLRGSAAVRASHPAGEGLIDIAVLQSLAIFGEIGVLLNQPRSASVTALERLYVLRFRAEVLNLLMEGSAAFSRDLSTILASRLLQTSQLLSFPQLLSAAVRDPGPSVFSLLPQRVVLEQKAVALESNEREIVVGFVSQPNAAQLQTVQFLFPDLRVRPCRIDVDAYERILDSYGLRSQVSSSSPAPTSSPSAPSLPSAGGTPLIGRINRPKLSEAEKVRRLGMIEPLLQGMLQERASDLHLSARQKPRWRIDGDLYEISESREIAAEEVFEVLEGVLPDRCYEEFFERHDTDFSFSYADLARFRVNLFQDDKGISASMRLISTEIPTAKQLRLPQNVRSLSEIPRGLVLVTGPTGSGKSSTLAAIIDQINKREKKHIITLEDPIEFVHKSQSCLVNQREVGLQAESFEQGLRSALREDPDIILVGEMRDMKTMSLAIEAANTGHLILGTLHTNDAISTIDRIVDMFPIEQHNKILGSLSDVLRGIVAQMLCKRKGGGRIGAFEVLYVTQGISALIRQGKTHQIISSITGSKNSNLINSHLEELVRDGLIDAREAVNQALDKDDIRQRLADRLPAADRAPVTPTVQGPQTAQAPASAAAAKKPGQ